MPFTARCVSCGFVVMANKRKTLNLLMEDHDSNSHKSSDGDWSIAVLTHIQYAMLVNASRLSAFWNAINTRLK
jgi:hypothetical protein